jgi:16S rRNA (guanine527-N7)-methyltransferase
MMLSERDRILAAARLLHLNVADRQIDLLIRFLDLLVQWNRTYNLTSIRQRDEMLVQHVFDCLAIIRPMASPLSPHRCLDVGSGGGLPATVIAIMLPDAQVVSVDTVGKKASFVRQVALELGLRNLIAEHARVEDLQAAPFDLVTARAFASLTDFTRLTRALIADSGRWMAMKGQVPTAEIVALPPDVEVFHVEQLQVPELRAERCLVWMKPRRDAA